MKAQTDILFAFGTWIVSSALFFATYSLLPDPAPERIQMLLPVKADIQHFRILSGAHCLATIGGKVQRSKPLTVELFASSQLGSQSSSKVEVEIAMEFDKSNTLVRMNGRVIGESTRLRISSQGISPVRVSVSGKLEQRPMSDMIDLPGPITLNYSEQPDSYSIEFPRKGLFRSGLLEYIEGAFREKLSLVPIEENSSATCLVGASQTRRRKDD